MATREQMLQDVQDEKDRKKADKAYSQSLRNTEYAPKTATKSVYVDNFPEEAAALRGVLEKQAKEKYEARAEAEKNATENAAARAEMGATFKENMKAGRVDEMGNAYKKGGSVSSASKRADGCAVKGKTKGRFV
jgi:hypothetical protein